MTGFADTNAETADDRICEHRDVAWFRVSFIENLIEQGYSVFCPKCGANIDPR